jgi:PqqD family protein of HPr-rel-A system
MKWRAISDPAFNARSWGNEFVVYNPLSGDTHLLGLAAAQILTHLHQAPSTAASLLASLAALWQVESNEELVLQVDAILADLDALALIERA